MKADQVLPLSIVVFFLGFSIGVLSEIQNISEIMEVIIICFATLLAAFGGAWLASWLQSRKIKETRRSKDLRCANYAQYVLARQMNALEHIAEKYLEPFEADPRRAMRMNWAYDWEEKLPLVDPQSLAFLLDTKYKSIILKIMLIEDIFVAAMRSMSLRSETFKNEIVPAVESANFNPMKNYKLADLEQAIGMRLAGKAVSLTESCYEQVPHAHNQIIEAQADLNLAFIEIFPGERFLDAANY